MPRGLMLTPALAQAWRRSASKPEHASAGEGLAEKDPPGQAERTAGSAQSLETFFAFPA